MAIQAHLIGAGRPIEGVPDVDLERDRELVVRYQAGEDEAFVELYQRYYPRIRGYCLRRVGNRHVAEELAQEAFLRALRAMPSFAGDRRFYPWITVIARRLCIDHHRRSGRSEPTANVDPGAVEAEQDSLMDAVDRDQLAKAIDRLAPRHRQVLALREQRAWSYQQIAAHLDVPLTTVEALLHRARKALRREYLAVTGGRRGRLAGVPLIGTLGAAVARLRVRVERFADTGWLPQAVAPAAAGVAALGIVLAPLATSPDAISTRVETSSSPAPASSVVQVVPADVPAVVPTIAAPAAVAAAAASSAPAPAGAPPPALNLGVAEVSHGPEAVAAADASNAQQPFQLDLGIIRIGLDPVQLVKDLLQPGIGGTQ